MRPLPMAAQIDRVFGTTGCAQHHALWDYYPNKRYGHRVTVCGDKAVLTAFIPAVVTEALQQSA